MASNILIKIYNNRNSLEWYSDHLIFHSLRLFDQYLSYAYNNPEISKREKGEKGMGKLHSEQENSIKFYTCLYIVYKYFTSLYQLHTWDEIFPRHLSIDSNVAKVEDFEKFILKEVVNYTVFKPTFLEYLSEDYTAKNSKLKDLDIRNYFMNYCNLTVNYQGTMEDLYNQVKQGV